MKTVTLSKDRTRASIGSILGALTLGFGLFVFLPGPASAQELFILSTESGMELYQVDNLVKPELLSNSNHSAIQPKAKSKVFSGQSMFLGHGMNGKPFVVNSGLQVTPNGRLLTMAIPVDEYPSPGLKTVGNELVASLQLIKVQNDLEKK